MRPRVLLLGHNYAPEQTGIGPYNTQLAEHLLARGCDVTVLTTFPHYPRYRWSVRPHLFHRERMAGVAVRRMRVILPRSSAAIWRVIFDSSVGASYLVNAFGIRRPGVVIATVPTLQGALVAALLARLWRAKSVFMVQDLPVEAGLAVGMLRPGLGLRIARWIESTVFRLGNHIVVISEVFRDVLLAKGLDPSKITVIPDWVDLDRIRPTVAEPGVRETLSGSTNGFLLLHTGAMAGKQGLETVVRAAEMLGPESDVHTVLVGDGPAKPELERVVASGGIRNVRFVGLQPEEYFPKMLAAADAVLLNQRANVVDAVAPSKLLNYMAAGKAVVAAVNENSVAAKLILEARAGLVVSPENPADLIRAIERLRAEPHLREQFGENGRAYAERHFARNEMLQRWYDIVVHLATES